MSYKAKDYSSLLGMGGISDNTLNNHFKLYQGYVTNTNTLQDRTEKLLFEGHDRTPDFAELRRRLGFEFNGMRLHEYYFENLGGSGEPMTNSLVYQQIEKDFGGFDRWRRDFISTGMMRGVGWIILYYDTRGDQMLNVWVNEHHTNNLAGVQPLLVMDAWEHAFLLDFQLDRSAYVEAFMSKLKWEEVARRFESNSEVQQRRKAA